MYILFDDFSLILRFRVYHIFRILEYSLYSTIPFHHFVPSFHRIGSTRYFDVRENAKRKANQCATKNWICQLHFIAPDTSPLRKQNVILGRNELSFRDQEVPRSRERQYSNTSLFFPLKADIGHRHEWFSPEKKIKERLSSTRGYVV